MAMARRGVVADLAGEACTDRELLFFAFGIQLNIPRECDGWDGEGWTCGAYEVLRVDRERKSSRWPIQAGFWLEWGMRE